MNTKKLKRFSAFILIFVLLTTNCGVSNTETPITFVPSESLTPHPLSLVSTNTIATLTVTHTPVSETSTIVVPTFSEEGKQQIIDQLLKEDYQCLLPCWGGIEPGVTTWPDAKLFLEQFAQIYSSQTSIYTAEFPYNGRNLVLGFYVRNSIMEFVAVPRFEYPLHRLLEDYGEPDEVYFSILDVLPIDTDNPYTVYLFYRERGIIAEYNGTSVKGKTISVCLMDSQGQKSQTAFLSLWSRGSDKSFDDIVTQYLSKFSDYSSLKYHKIEELSSFTPQEFYELYNMNDNQNNCIEINNPNPEPT